MARQTFAAEFFEHANFARPNNRNYESYNSQDYMPQQSNSYQRAYSTPFQYNNPQEAVKNQFRTILNRSQGYDEDEYQNIAENNILSLARDLLQRNAINYNELLSMLESLRPEYRTTGKSFILHNAIEKIQRFSQQNTRAIEKPQANKLIEQSYFSPEMQYAVLACVNKEFKVNVVTGKVENLPTVLDIVNSSPTDNTIKINGLHAALEAVQVARFYAKLNIAYDNPAYVFFAPTLSSNLFLMPSLDEELEEQLTNYEKDIKTALQQIPEYNSVWSWIPTDLVNMFTITSRGETTQQIIQESKLEFNADINNLDKRTYPGNFVTIAGSTLKDVIKNFDYKQKVNVQQAANLLFKQCFIAQQTFPKQDWPLYCTPLGNTVTASNYIFDRFEVTRTKINSQTNSQFEQINKQSIQPTYAENIDELCNIIAQSANIAPHNQLQAHLLFLRIRKAIQTAMYIANKNSNFYIGYILPPAITKYLDGIVQQLILYDQKLSALCKNQQLGATKDDLLRDKIWNNITGVATGLGVLGAVATAIDYGYGAGTSVKIAENSAENATYYGGKALANTAYYGTTIPLQTASNVVTGTVSGATSVASGLIKGTQHLASDTYNSIPINIFQHNNQITKSTQTELQEKTEKLIEELTPEKKTSYLGIIEQAQALL